MTAHTTTIKRSGNGVIGTCTCRLRQLEAQPTKALADDWCQRHLSDVNRIAALIDKPLSDVKYLALLEENAADTRRSTAEREQWAMLAREFAPRVKGKKLTHDTGVETEPLF